jgi:hypothetical protein
LESNGKHQSLVYVDDVNALGKNINNIKRNTEVLLVATKEISLEVNTEKSIYVFMSRHQSAGQNHNLMTANKSFDNVAKIKCFGMTLTDQNCTPEEIKSRLNSGDA